MDKYEETGKSNNTSPISGTKARQSFIDNERLPN